MQFNSEANSLDLVSDVKFWCGIDSADTTTYPLTAIARNANFALDKITTLIFRSDRNWVFDDSNNSDLPIATSTLVNNQADYGIPVTHLRILKVRILDSGGNYYSIEQVNREDISDADLESESGAPERYYLLGSSIVLNPAPNTGVVTAALGLEIQFQRGASYFASSDTTKVPGFSSNFHRLVSLYTARDFCMANDIQNRLTRIENEITKLEKELVEFYGRRNANDRDALMPGRIAFK